MNSEASKEKERTTVVEQERKRARMKYEFYTRNSHMIDKLANIRPFKTILPTSRIGKSHTKQASIVQVEQVISSPVKRSAREYINYEMNKSRRESDEREEKLLDVHQEKGMFGCFCSICYNHSKPNPNNQTLHRMPEKLIKSLEVVKNDAEYRKKLAGDEKSFYWLMHHLLPFSDKIKGCELIFPDTVFFKNGKPRIIIRSDKDLCLQGIKAPSRLNLTTIFKDFQNITRERKRDNIGIFRMKYGNHAVSKLIVRRHEDFEQNSFERESDRNPVLDIQSQDQTTMTMEQRMSIRGSTDATKYIYFKDIAIIRHNTIVDY